MAPIFEGKDAKGAKPGEPLGKPAPQQTNPDAQNTGEAVLLVTPSSANSSATTAG